MWEITAISYCKVERYVLKFKCNSMQSHEKGVEIVEALYIRMLGGFSISTDTNQISDRDNRSRKIWTLLAYLVYHRHRTIMQEELINLLWGEEEQGTNPVSALKTMFHRARGALDKLWPSAGHDLILSRNGGYMWNPDIELRTDIEEFDRLSNAEPETDEILSRDSRLLQLYQGDFLANMSSEVWVIPIAAYYHNNYIQSLLRILPVLQTTGRYNEMAEHCQVAAAVEPFSEEIHCFFMHAMLGLNDQKGAANIYKQFSERLFLNFGIMPGEEMRALYYEAVKTNNGHAVTIDVIRGQLREEASEPGALMCEYDFFRVLYRSMARSMLRNGMAAHIALFSVEGDRKGELSRRKLEGAVDMLGEEIRNSLRRGDAAAKCSASQYVIMLPQANYENSCMVCERVIRSYYQKHPHSDAIIRYAVYPLEPDEGSFQMRK